MDFATLPPEVNSGLMYAGPGSGPIIAAAASWDNLASEVSSAAGDYGSVIAGLSSGSWQGPASMSMVAAAAPYVSWMNATAAQAEQAADQAKAAASAYEAAFTRRLRRRSSLPTARYWQHWSPLTSLPEHPAIATTEAHYAEMWAQDAAAMYGYAGSSAAASTLTPIRRAAGDDHSQSGSWHGNIGAAITIGDVGPRRTTRARFACDVDLVHSGSRQERGRLSSDLEEGEPVQPGGNPQFPVRSRRIPVGRLLE